MNKQAMQDETVSFDVFKEKYTEYLEIFHHGKNREALLLSTTAEELTSAITTFKQNLKQLRTRGRIHRSILLIQEHLIALELSEAMYGVLVDNTDHIKWINSVITELKAEYIRIQSPKYAVPDGKVEVIRNFETIRILPDNRLITHVYSEKREGYSKMFGVLEPILHQQPEHAILFTWNSTVYDFSPNELLGKIVRQVKALAFSRSIKHRTLILN
jgi:hypothetical protein